MIPRRAVFMCLLMTAGVVLSGVLGGGCVRGGKEDYRQYGYQGVKKIGIVFSTQGEWNTGAGEGVLKGVQRAANDLDAEYKVLAPGSLVNNEESLRYLAENNYELVMAVGPGIDQDLKRVVPDYPDIKFAILNGDVDQPNVVRIRFNEEEGAFLAGVAAASLTKTGLVGYLGGSAAADRKLENGFAKGVQYVNQLEGKQVAAAVYYPEAMTNTAAGDPQQAKSPAGVLYGAGADVVFCGAPRLDSGLAMAAVQSKKIALCNDPQLMRKWPWNVYGAIISPEEAVVSEICKKTLSGKFTGGKNIYGVAEGAIDFVPGQALPPDLTAKLKAVKDEIKKGWINPANIEIPAGLVSQVKQAPGPGQAGPAGTDRRPTQGAGAETSPQTPGGEASGEQTPAGESAGQETPAGESAGQETPAGESAGE